MWHIVRIDEADYGCEERLPGEPLLVLITIECDETLRMAQFECPEEWLVSQGLDEGDEWPEDIDAIDNELSRLDHMSDWMDNYYSALEELEG